MLGSERKIYILKQLEANGTVHLQEICEKLKTSESTIRRDFEELEEQRKLKRVHGGAIKIQLNSILNETKELSMNEKLNINVEMKKALCAYCANLVKDGDCIFVDGGTTFAFLTSYLEGKKIKIVTHSDFVRSKKDSSISVYVIGGVNVPSYEMNVGPITLQMLKKFNFDIAFIGCAGVLCEEKAAYTAELGSAQVKEYAMSQAIKSYLVVDSTKMDTKGFYKFADTDIFEEVVTNELDRKKIPANFKIVR